MWTETGIRPAARLAEGFRAIRNKKSGLALNRARPLLSDLMQKCTAYGGGGGGGGGGVAAPVPHSFTNSESFASFGCESQRVKSSGHDSSPPICMGEPAT